MKIPYPNMNGNLAFKPHMYICKKSDAPLHEFIKCQTLKPYMLNSNIIKHYYDEDPDLSRNPFRHTTRIDCDKLFQTLSVMYNPRLKTGSRPDVCDELFRNLLKELEADGFETININEDELRQLNPLIV